MGLACSTEECPYCDTEEHYVEPPHIEEHTVVEPVHHRRYVPNYTYTHSPHRYVQPIVHHPVTTHVPTTLTHPVLHRSVVPVHTTTHVDNHVYD